jgi:hypothetical protein
MMCVDPMNIGISKHFELSLRGIQWVKGVKTRYGSISTAGRGRNISEIDNPIDRRT